MGKEEIQLVAQNKKARFKFNILDRFEAGIALRGTEVKSLRDKKVSISESYGRVHDGEVFLHDMNISPYPQGNQLNHNPTRPRKLLLHKREIARIIGRIQERGFTLVPLRVYFKRGLAKVEVAIARGKSLYDKRETLKKRDAERQIRREYSRRR